MNVQVIDVKSGKPKTMSVRYANILVKMKRARWPGDAEQVSGVEPNGDSPQQAIATEVVISKAAKNLAQTAGVDLSKVVGSGKDGAITKPDVEAFIAALKETQE